MCYWVPGSECSARRREAPAGWPGKEAEGNWHRLTGWGSEPRRLVPRVDTGQGPAGGAGGGCRGPHGHERAPGTALPTPRPCPPPARPCPPCPPLGTAEAVPAVSAGRAGPGRAGGKRAAAALLRQNAGRSHSIPWCRRMAEWDAGWSSVPHSTAPGVQYPRHEELANAGKERDAMPASMKEAQVKQLKKLKQQIRELHLKPKSLETELCRREWSHSACIRETDTLTRKYKQQLSLAAEQEWILEQSKMETELNWRQLSENAEHNQYQKSEDLTQSLSSSGEEVEAGLQKTDCGLHEVKPILSLTREQASFHHSILPERQKQIFQYDDKCSLCKDISALEIKKLQKQNANLRAAVAQMRKEMESLDEQMSSRPLTKTRQLAEQGSVSTHKISTGTTLSGIEAHLSSAQLDCIVRADTEKGPEPKVLEEKITDLGQQLPDVGPGVELQYDVRHTLQGMQNKLKEAARKISILSQEKQQLIEMGNRLREELGMLLKEGLWRRVSSECCTVCISSGSLLPRELVKRTQCQLSALKHLQHRLTSQKLQYARQQHPSRFSSLVACPGLKEEEAPNSWGEEAELPSTEVQLDFSIENHGPDRQKADAPSKTVQSQPLRQSPSQVEQVQLSSSRVHNFCQGVWQTLEMESSLSILSPQVKFEVIHSTEQSEEPQQNVKAKDKPEMPAGDLTVRGKRLEVQQKIKSRNLSCAHLSKPKISSHVAKIRNYNIKD
ncbi:coiled-coil domain-containing protein 57 [Pithys albifrons albifrons]|uniref:coiled-coil domain-containing protein 57 n=1 Tax=Pithys albifrons albifrons TaxID=3385563 RepID=UPI003A5CF53B